MILLWRNFHTIIKEWMDENPYRSIERQTEKEVEKMLLFYRKKRRAGAMIAPNPSIILKRHDKQKPIRIYRKES
jgi:hypothetical protein